MLQCTTVVKRLPENVGCDEWYTRTELLRATQHAGTASREPSALGAQAVQATVVALATVTVAYVERGSSELESRTRNQGSSGSNPPLLPFRRLCMFVLSIDAPVDSTV